MFGYTFTYRKIERQGNNGNKCFAREKNKTLEVTNKKKKTKIR